MEESSTSLSLGDQSRSTKRSNRKAILAVLVCASFVLFRVHTGAPSSIQEEATTDQDLARDRMELESKLEDPALTENPTLSLILPQTSPPSHALVISEGTIEDDDHSKTQSLIQAEAVTTQDISRDPASAFNDNDSRPRPVLVILVGPPKTATTTLQAYLTDPQTQADLRKDNYLYQGRFGKIKSKRKDAHLLRTLTDGSCKQKTQIAREQKQAMPECWNSFTRELDRLYQTRQNVILVEENLSDACFDLPAFQQATTKWQVLIVITYRQFWSWLPSFKNQIEKMDKNLHHFSSKPKSSNPLPWLLDGPRTTSSPEFYKAMISLNNRKAIRVAKVHTGMYLPYTDTIVKLYRDLENQVRIMNIHLDNITVTSNFVCKILPNAPNSCQASLDQSSKKGHMTNPSINLDYDLIAVDAVDRGMLGRRGGTKLDRRRVVRTLKQYHNEKLESRPLPLECVDQVSLEAMLAESMRLERELVPDFYEAHEEQHRNNFWNAAAKNKFCSVNTTAVLIDPDWLSLFEQLKNESASDSKH
jgi:hypothetical protein